VSAFSINMHGYYLTNLWQNCKTDNVYIWHSTTDDSNFYITCSSSL